MPDTLRSPRHNALRVLLKERRKTANLSQAELAEKLGRYQSYVSDIESGQRRVDVVEFLDFAEALGFDPRGPIKRLMSIRRR